MATESPIRMLETSGKWPSHKDAATFAPSSANMAADEMGLFLNGHRFHRSGRDVDINRSGSAPPSIEGSLVAIENLISQRDFNLNASLVSLDSSIKNRKSEEQSVYSAYNCSNVNLNPRLPPPLLSRENRHLVRHMGGFGNSWRLTSLDDSGNGSLHLPQVPLSTHKEEPEDDRSPQSHSDDWIDKRRGFWSGQDATSLEGRHKSLVGLIQEDFPRTPSPVYNHSLSISHVSKEEAVDPDADSSSLHDPSVCTSNSDATGIESEMKALNMSSIPSLEIKKNQEWQHSQQNNLLQNQVHQQQSNTFQILGGKCQIISQGMNQAYIGMDQFLRGPSEFSAEVQPVLQSSGFTPPLYATPAAYMTPGNSFYPNLQPPGLYSPQYGLGGYALNTTVLPSYVAGYPPHGAIPFAYDGSAGPSFNTRTSGVSAGGNIAHGVEMQHLNKSYGQLGFGLQPSFADPLHMQYFQQPFWNAYTDSGQLDPLASRGGVVGSHMSTLDSRKGSDGAACSDDQKLPYQRAGGLSNLNPRRGGIMSNNYFGSPTNMGILMQFPTSPLASPVFPGSPVSGTSLPGARSELRFPPDSGRNAGIYSGWQGQRGFQSFDDPKAYSFLEELKSGKVRRFELSDISGHIVEFSADQHGSRFIQQKLENCSVEEKASVFKEVLPHASHLMTDVFGNYVIQKFFEYGSPEQRKELGNQLASQILPLSLQMYGCRVIQKNIWDPGSPPMPIINSGISLSYKGKSGRILDIKCWNWNGPILKYIMSKINFVQNALEFIDVEQKTNLVHELDGHVMKCVRDQNGNHVIQKCIESVPTDKIGFIISAFRGQVASLSTHPYGCRVIQRVLEHCTDDLQSQFIVDEILESVCDLAQDQYGNYVTQHVLERGRPHERSQIISKLSGHIVQLSQHKFASNVIEKCLEHGDIAERELLIQEIVGHNEGNDNLLTMMKDQYANYVVQKVLEMCTDNQREILLSRIKAHAHALKKYTYGKHIVARFEQLFGEEIQISGS
ncbi:hypothetical protein L1049_001103 [Liquidambar formosana]|uniref:PUM-HD domain-containing protein n=1 Tax=Liquidambar formosana TaxID=63359 RepID=A0AAP0NBU1_LIQFO